MNQKQLAAFPVTINSIYDRGIITSVFNCHCEALDTRVGAVAIPQSGVLLFC